MRLKPGSCLDLGGRRRDLICLVSPRLVIHWLQLVLLVFVLITIPRVSSGDLEAIGLKTHNEHRKKHQSPDMTIDETMNEIARKCAKHYLDKNDIDHSCPFKETPAAAFKKHGENLYRAENDISSSPEVCVKLAIDLWYEEIQHYDYKNATFKKGSSKEKGDQIGHFTQLVWKGSKVLGIGHIEKDGVHIVVALYEPAGNVKEQYQENVIPPVGGAHVHGSGHGKNGDHGHEGHKHKPGMQSGHEWMKGRKKFVRKKGHGHHHDDDDDSKAAAQVCSKIVLSACLIISGIYTLLG